MSTLILYPTEQLTPALMPRSEALDSEQHLSLCALVLQSVAHQNALAPASQRLSTLGPVGETLLLEAVAAEADGPLRGMAGTAGLVRSLQRVFLAAGCAGLTPATLSRLGRRLASGPTPRAAARINELAALYKRYRELLGPRRLDTGLLYHRGITGLGQLPLLQQVDCIELRGLHRHVCWDAVPTPHGLLLALDALAQDGRQVRLCLPDVPTGDDSPLAQQALAPIYDALFRKHDLDLDEVRVPLGPFAPDAPHGRFVQSLLAKAGSPSLLQSGELTEAQLQLQPLPSPRAEAQHVAQQVRDLLDSGVAPSQIGVLAQSSEQQERLLRALARYGVPVTLVVPGDSALPWALPGSAAVSGLPPSLLAILGLYDLLAAGLPREGLIQSLTSRYFCFPGPLARRPWQVARALRAAGVRQLQLAESALVQPQLFAEKQSRPTERALEGQDYRQRLLSWLRQQAVGQRSSGSSAAASDASATTAESSPLSEAQLLVLRQVESVLRELEALPAQASLATHCTALHRLAERLMFYERAASLACDARWLCQDSEDDEEAASELAALELQSRARDQAAVSALQQALQELPRQSRRLSLPEQPLSRQRFVALLRTTLLRLLHAGPGSQPTGAEVLVGDLHALAGRSFAQLFVTGCSESELLPRLPEDPLLSDDDRRALTRLLEAPVWPLCQEATERAPLLLIELLARCHVAHLSWPQTDDEGRPLLRASLVETVLHAAARPEPPPARFPLLPFADAARHKSELWAQAVLSRSWPASPDPRAETSMLGAQPLGRPHLLTAQDIPASRRFADAAVQVRASGPWLLDVLQAQQRTRATQLLGRIQLEQLRARWFAAVLAESPIQKLAPLAGPFVGRLVDSQAIVALQHRLPGGAAHPLSASALEDYAKCPFRFFVRRVLKAVPLIEAGEDLDPLAHGRLHHAVLEDFYRDRQCEGRLPLRDDADDRAALDRVLQAQLEQFKKKERIGHPALLAVRVRRLRVDLLRLISREANDPSDPDCLPARFEHSFGPLRIAAAKSGSGASDDDSQPLHIHGIIDRIDLGPGRAVVLDYKAGRLPRYEQILAHELLDTSFQLPLYAAALTVDKSLFPSGEPPAQVTARYYSLRQGRTTRKLLDNADMISLDPQVRQRVQGGNVAEVVYQKWRELRAGDFRVAPRTCDGCGLEATCRIASSAPQLQPEVSEPPRSGDSGKPAPSAITSTRDLASVDDS